MMLNDMRILETVTNIALKVSDKWTSEKKKQNIKRMIDHTVSHLISAADDPDAFSSISEFKRAALVFFCIYAELCSYKQYSSLPELQWHTAADEAYQKLKASLSPSELDDVDNTPQRVSDCLKEVFIALKEKMMPKDILVEINRYERELREKLWNKPDSETDDILNNTYQKFMLTYGPESGTEVTAAYHQYFSNERKSYYSSSERNKNILLYQGSDADEDNFEFIKTIPDKDSLPPDEYHFQRSAELKICEVMRDLLNTPKKLGITNIQMKYYRCFYTDNISAIIETSESIYRYFCNNIKQYSFPEITDIDFLNFFVDAKCLSITDAYRKPRRLMSEFKPGCTSNERCKQPLELIVFSKYLGKDISSVSPKLKAYRELIRMKI